MQSKSLPSSLLPTHVCELAPSLWTVCIHVVHVRPTLCISKIEQLLLFSVSTVITGRDCGSVDGCWIHTPRLGARKLHFQRASTRAMRVTRAWRFFFFFPEWIFTNNKRSTKQWPVRWKLPPHTKRGTLLARRGEPKVTKQAWWARKYAGFFFFFFF